MGKFPLEDRLLNKTVNKERDAVQRAISLYKEKGVDSMPWSQFQKELQQVAQKFPKLFTEIRHNKPAIALSDLEQWLQKAERGEKYDISYDRYHQPEHSYRDIEQLVVQINASADITKKLKSDPDLAQLFEFINHGSNMAGHPAGRNGVGWVRIDYLPEEDMIYVDEIQSDIINQVSSFKNYLQTKTPNEWFELQNDKLKKQILERFGRGSIEPNWSGVRGALSNMGMTPEKLEESKEKFTQMFEEWVEFAIASVLEMARTHGIQNVAIASGQAILKRDPSVSKEKVKMFYDNMARGFGFKEKQIESVPELKGTKVWVRKASLKFR